MLGDLLKRNPLTNRLRGAWRHEADEALKPVRKELRRLARQVEQLQAALAETAERAARGDRYASQLKLILELNERQRALVASLPAALDEEAVRAHVRKAVDAAPLQADPYEHIVVNDVLPRSFYDLLLAAIPPPVFFMDHDPIKQDLPLPLEFGTAFATATWNFMDDVVARRIIEPLVFEKFHQPLQAYYDTIFGPGFRDRANALPHLASGSRLMLRRPGYRLAPHRDPKRSLLTCLLYLARIGDDEAHGTQLFRVADDREASYKQTYYPEAEGGRCELVKVVPFRANSMLVFMNSRGAHGAVIPPDAPAALERYTYQFYLAPENAALGALIRELPSERRIMWQNKNRIDSTVSSPGREPSAAPSDES